MRLSQAFFRENGIIRLKVIPNNSYANCLAKRMNIILLESVKCIIFDAKIIKSVREAIGVLRCNSTSRH